MDITQIDTSAASRFVLRAADDYHCSDWFQREVALRLLARLDFIKINPDVIVDCGRGNGYTTRLLHGRFPKATLFAYDFCPHLLEYSCKDRPFFSMTGSMTELPFRDFSVDLLFANLSLHWSGDIEKTLKEYARVLKSDGLLLLSTLGVDTLRELRACFEAVDARPHVHRFMDMHDLGDLLLSQKLKDPVMDMEILNLQYQSIDALVYDLKKTGLVNAACDRLKGLYSPRRWQMVKDTYQQQRNHEGRLPVTTEVIYGHAWGMARDQLDYVKNDNVVYFSVDDIKYAKKTTDRE